MEFYCLLDTIIIGHMGTDWSSEVGCVLGVHEGIAGHSVLFVPGILGTFRDFNW